jgi:peptidoglycan/xylan/chitin deacetylase (PgdA/CDA1 family)
MNIPILMYHSIMDNHDKSVSINSFELQMKLMRKMGYQTINFSDLNKNITKKKFIITFDDGYENLITNVFPVLKKLEFSATCFVVTNMLNKYNVWDENRSDYKKMKLMNIDQIYEWVSNGFEIGSHTKDHLDLTSLDINKKKEQIIDSKNFINQSLGIKITSFAYPFGSFDDETIKIVQENYEYAVTTRPSKYNPNKFDDMKLPRISINKKTSIFKFLLKILTNYENLKYKA